MSPTIFPLIILCVFRQLKTAGNPKISPPGSRKSALWHFSLCSRAFHRAPNQNFICSVTRIQQMFNIYIHIRGKANPTHHWLTCAYTFSCEQLQPGIFKTAVQRVSGVTVSQRASPLNVARCSQIREKKFLSLWGGLTLGRAEASFGAFLLVSLPPAKRSCRRLLIMHKCVGDDVAPWKVIGDTPAWAGTSLSAWQHVYDKDIVIKAKGKT